jgi:hypothetical protein
MAERTNVMAALRVHTTYGIAVHLLKTEEQYDPAKVSVVPAS